MQHREAHCLIYQQDLPYPSYYYRKIWVCCPKFSHRRECSSHISCFTPRLNSLPPLNIKLQCLSTASGEYSCSLAVIHAPKSFSDLLQWHHSSCFHVITLHQPQWSSCWPGETDKTWKKYPKKEHNYLHQKGTQNYQVTLCKRKH